MDIFDNNKIAIQRANAPEGMFEEIKQRLVETQTQAVTTHRQLTFSVSLLMVIAICNIGILLYKNNASQQNYAVNAAKTLSDEYFTNHLILSNE